MLHPLGSWGNKMAVEPMRTLASSSMCLHQLKIGRWYIFC
uniref:Uncharacterized protein n=1 Tax=Rhizophora mucronata TaxID=61149 RepID=A0A2P2PEW2_RHIMU